jgi:hypothetical protein
LGNEAGRVSAASERWHVRIRVHHGAQHHGISLGERFGWTRTQFPFHTSSAKKLTLNQTPVVTVTGKAYFDVGHSLKDQRSNRRSHLPGYAAWEIR